MLFNRTIEGLNAEFERRFLFSLTNPWFIVELRRAIKTRYKEGRYWEKEGGVRVFCAYVIILVLGVCVLVLFLCTIPLCPFFRRYLEKNGEKGKQSGNGNDLHAVSVCVSELERSETKTKK